MTGAHTPTQPPTRRATGLTWLRTHSRPWMLYGLGAIVLALALALSLIYTSHSNSTQDALDTANNQVTAVKSQAAPLAGQVQSVCDQGGVAATELNNAGACTQASKVQSVIEIPGPSGPQGPGPSQAQIDDAVSGYFATHPLPAGQLPPVTEVAGLVAQYLQANPPANGQNATPAMVSDAVTNYCAANNGCAGPAGQNATDQQVANQVAAYCAAHGDCAGPAGSNGTNGTNGAPGPECPSGYAPTSAIVEVPTSDPNNPLITSTQVPGIACVQQ